MCACVRDFQRDTEYDKVCTMTMRVSGMTLEGEQKKFSESNEKDSYIQNRKIYIFAFMQLRN